jgi:uncharacterized protein YjiS (DUF1127 family)
MSTVSLAARANASGTAARPSLFHRLLAHIVRARTIHARRRLLNQLPDHLLKDIGISRCNIDYVASALADGRDDPTLQRGFGGR